MNPDKIAEYTELFVDWAVVFVPKLLMALAILIIGFYIVKKISKMLKLGLQKSNLDYEISEFLGSFSHPFDLKVFYP